MRTPERGHQPEVIRRNAMEQVKIGGEPAKGVVWALIYIGDQIGRLVSATAQSTDLNREVWEDEKNQKQRSSDVS